VFVELDVEQRGRFGRLLGYLYIPDNSGAWVYEGRSYSQVNNELVDSFDYVGGVEACR
jgi:micrococcal nuclease